MHVLKKENTCVNDDQTSPVQATLTRVPISPASADHDTGDDIANRASSLTYRYDNNDCDVASFLYIFTLTCQSQFMPSNQRHTKASFMIFYAKTKILT